jgi:hypothetical protein
MNSFLFAAKFFDKNFRRFIIFKITAFSFSSARLNSTFLCNNFIWTHYWNRFFLDSVKSWKRMQLFVFEYLKVINHVSQQKISQVHKKQEQKQER